MLAPLDSVIAFVVLVFAFGMLIASFTVAGSFQLPVSFEATINRVGFVTKWFVGVNYY